MMLKRNTFIGRFARAISPSPGRPRTSVLLLSLASLLGFVGTAHAQATPTAEKAGGLDVFGTFTFMSPDFGQTNDAGVSVGGALLLKRTILGQPALAVRYSTVTGSEVNETFIGGGGELHYHYRMVNPYATVLYGVGSLALPAGSYRDSGNTLLLGGGADVPVSRRFSARAEFTYSFVDITGFHNTSVGAINLTPWAFNIGAVYHIK